MLKSFSSLRITVQLKTKRIWEISGREVNHKNVQVQFHFSRLLLLHNNVIWLDCFIISVTKKDPVREKVVHEWINNVHLIVDAKQWTVTSSIIWSHRRIQTHTHAALTSIFIILKVYSEYRFTSGNIYICAVFHIPLLLFFFHLCIISMQTSRLHCLAMKSVNTFKKTKKSSKKITNWYVYWLWYSPLPINEASSYDMLRPQNFKVLWKTKGWTVNLIRRGEYTLIEIHTHTFARSTHCYINNQYKTHVLSRRVYDNSKNSSHR